MEVLEYDLSRVTLYGPLEALPSLHEIDMLTVVTCSSRSYCRAKYQTVDLVWIAGLIVDRYVDCNSTLKLCLLHDQEHSDSRRAWKRQWRFSRTSLYTKNNVMTFGYFDSFVCRRHE
jgi:hypothetical protein